MKRLRSLLPRELFWFPCCLCSHSTGFGLLPSPLCPMLFVWNRVLSFLYPLFFYHLQVFPPPCHWTPFTKQWFNSMVTKGFCRARPALKKPQVVGYDSLSVGQKKKKMCFYFERNWLCRLVSLLQPANYVFKNFPTVRINFYERKCKILLYMYM